MENLSRTPPDRAAPNRSAAAGRADRRQDHTLRSAVNNIQSLLFDINLEQSLYQTVLDQLLTLTQSSIGTALAVHDITGTPTLNTKVLVSKKPDSHQDSYVNIASELNDKSLLEFVRKHVNSRRTVFFNDNLPSELITTFQHITHSLNNILIVPIFVADSLTSLYIVANSSGDYRASLCVRLHPIIAASECVVRTSLLIDKATTIGGNNERQRLNDKFSTPDNFKTLSELVPGGVIEIDEHWECHYANDKWFELCGTKRENAYKLPWYNVIHPNDLDNTLLNLDNALIEKRDFKQEIRLVNPRGKIRWVSINARALYDNQREVNGFLAYFNDISEQRRTQERLRRVAEHDSLTGLANRVLFQDRLQQMLVATERDEKKVALLFIDLDGFKDINDTLGHDAGDTLLKHVARRLVNALRNEDTVARFGGDEFTVLLRHVQEGDYVPMVAEKVIRTLSAPFLVNTHEVFVTASIGISVGSSNDCDAQILMKQADIALYKAKAEGRNRFHYFTPEMDKQAHVRLQLINSIHRALDNNELAVKYQPQACTKSGKLVGFEALMRWRHPEMGHIPPKKFIPLMEESNVIVTAGNWVLQQACRQLQYWRERSLVGSHVTLSVNVSARQFNHTDLVNEVSSTLQRTNLPPENLILEITESVLINKAKRASKQIKQLKALGVKFALDDFGTGYSSLSYLQKFPIDQIKIDQSFIRDVKKDPQDANITKAIIALAHNLGMKVTAEGVADEDTLEFLVQEHCDCYQGYHLSRAKSANALSTSLKLKQRVVPIRLNVQR